MSAPLSSELQKLFAVAKDIATSAGRTSTSCDLLLAMLAYPNEAVQILHEHGVDLDDLAIKLLEAKPASDISAKELEGEVRRMAGVCGANAAELIHLFSVLLSNKSSLARKVLQSTGLNIEELWSDTITDSTGSSLLPRANRAGYGAGGRVYGQGDRFAPGFAAGGGASVGPGSGAAAAAINSAGVPVVASVPVGSPGPAGGVGRQPVPGASGHHSRPHTQPPLSRPPTEPGPSPADFRSEPPPAPPARTPMAPPAAEQLPRGPFMLAPGEFPVLTAIGRNLTQLAADGALDPVVHRDDIIEQMLDIISKRRSNNPCLIGESGVGKSAIVDGLALQLVREYGEREAREGNGAAAPTADPTVVVAIEPSALFAGTYLRGSLNERVASLRTEVKGGQGKIIILFDQIHTLLGAGEANSTYADALLELKSALSLGEFPCIGITTPQEYQNHIEVDPGLARAFEPIYINEPSHEETCRIMESILPRYEAHHRIEIPVESAELAVRLTTRFIPDRALPDKAISIMDLAAARASRRNLKVLEPAMISEVVANQIDVPVEKLLMTDQDRLLHMEDWVGERLVGHQKQVSAIARAVRRNQVGFHGRRPIGSFLFLGPTGVGKTECAKVLAEFLFHDRNSMTRMDMSEYMESHSSARLIGAPPGYVGYTEGGQLTDAVRRRPYQLVLFDEVEKAHPDVLNLLLQIFEEGCLTDSRGRVVDFSNTLIILTSNLGASHFKSSGVPRRVGFAPSDGGESKDERGFTSTGNGSGSGGALPRSYGHVLTGAEKEALEERVFREAKGALSPELWNRFDDKLLFHPLSPDQIISISNLMLSGSQKQLFNEKQIRLLIDEDVPRWLTMHGGYDPELGARPLRRTIHKHLEAPLAELILSNAVQAGDVVKVSVRPSPAKGDSTPGLPGGSAPSSSRSTEECLIFRRALR